MFPVSRDTFPKKVSQTTETPAYAACAHFIILVLTLMLAPRVKAVATCLVLIHAFYKVTHFRLTLKLTLSHDEIATSIY